MKHFYKELLSEEFIQNLIKKEEFIDARRGGLVLGNSHDNGGVIFLYQFPEGFRVFGELEGYEYVLPREITQKNQKLIRKINNHERDFDDRFEEYQIPNNIITIDARKNESQSKYILCDSRGGFSIINKHSTKIHLKKLDELNRNHLFNLGLDPYNKQEENEMYNEQMNPKKTFWKKITEIFKK